MMRWRVEPDGTLSTPVQGLKRRVQKKRLGRAYRTFRIIMKNAKGNVRVQERVRDYQSFFDPKS